MDSDVVHLVSEVLLGFEEEDGALLEFGLDKIDGILVTDHTLLNLLPQQLRVPQQKHHVLFFVADVGNLLLKLLGPLKALLNVLFLLLL